MKLQNSNRIAINSILILSTGILAFLFWLIYFREPKISDNTIDLSFLPSLNALLNFLSATCLSFGFLAIRKGKRDIHIKMMSCALILSSLFLISYLVYHTYHGDTSYQGEGWLRNVYFFILISHVFLSILVLPLILTTVFYAITKNFASHSKIAKVTFPIWLYVSITGVLVYIILYIF